MSPVQAIALQKTCDATHLSIRYSMGCYCSNMAKANARFYAISTHSLKNVPYGLTSPHANSTRKLPLLVAGTWGVPPHEFTPRVRHKIRTDPIPGRAPHAQGSCNRWRKQEGRKGLDSCCVGRGNDGEEMDPNLENTGVDGKELDPSLRGVNGGDQSSLEQA